MRKILLFLSFLFISIFGYSQECIVELPQFNGDTISVGMHNVQYLNLITGGVLLVDGERGITYETTMSLDNVIAAANGKYLKFTDEATGDERGIAMTFVKTVSKTSSGKAVIVTNNNEASYITTEDFYLIASRAGNCLTAGVDAGTLADSMAVIRQVIIDSAGMTEAAVAQLVSDSLAIVYPRDTITRLFQDSIIQYWLDGSIVGLDTITGMDNQTASEVPVVDAGGFFDNANDNVELVLQELGDSVLQHLIQIQIMQTLKMDEGEVAAIVSDSITLVELRDTITKLYQDSILQYILDDVVIYQDTIRTPGSGGSGTTNQVYVISALSDTTTISGEIEGDVAYVNDTIVAFRDDLYWLPMFGGGAGGGGLNEAQVVAIVGDTAAILRQLDTTSVLVQDSILTYNVAGTEISRDTIRIPFTSNYLVVDSFPQIAGMIAGLNQTIFSNREQARYRVQVDSIVGFTNDSITVHPVTGGYAILQPSSDNSYNIGWFGAKSDGFDDRGVIINGLNFSKVTQTKTLVVPNDTFHISKYIYIDFNVHIKGTKGSVIYYQSADETLVTDATATSDAQVRSMFLVEADNFELSGIKAIGQDTANVLVNIGNVVYLKNSANPRISNVRLLNGCSIYQQERNSNDKGMVMSDCYSYNNIGSINPASFTVIQNSTIEKDETTTWDRVGDLGSSHGIYGFAGVENVTIDNCILKNIRVDGVKFSGSSLPIRNIEIINCTFDRCGKGIEWGADDNQEHTNMLISGCTFIDCGTSRDNWGQGAGIKILGSDGTEIINCHFIYTQDRVYTTNAVRGIEAGRFGAATQPVSNITISNVSFKKQDGFTPTTNILLNCITLNNVNQDAYTGQTCLIEKIQIDSVSSEAFEIDQCFNPELKDFTITGVATVGTVKNSAFPELKNFTFDHSDEITDNPGLTINDCAWPTLNNMTTVGIRGTNRIQNFRTKFNNVNDALIFPQMDKGWTAPTQGLQEVWIGYGGGWETGDIVDINGTNLVYNTDFTTPATLITAIDAIGGRDSDDVGAFLSTVTNHIRVTYTSGSASNGVIYVKTTTNRRTAGVVLKNPTTTTQYGQMKTYGASLTANKAVIFSPQINDHSFVQLKGYDNNSNLFLGVVGWHQSVTVNNSVSEIEFGLPSSGSEVFQYFIK